MFASAGSAGGASKRAALKLLQQEPLQSVPSVIVYCTFQSQADEIAQYMYSQGISALSYHAGKSFKVCPTFFAVARTALLQYLRLTKLLPATCIDGSQSILWYDADFSDYHHTIGKAWLC